MEWIETSCGFFNFEKIIGFAVYDWDENRFMVVADFEWDIQRDFEKGFETEEGARKYIRDLIAFVKIQQPIKCDNFIGEKTTNVCSIGVEL